MWVGKLGIENIDTEYIKLAQYHSTGHISDFLFYTFLCILSFYVGRLIIKIKS
jgi:hypothetical protein